MRYFINHNKKTITAKLKQYRGMLQSEGILHQSWSPEHKTLVCLSAYLFINPHQETEKQFHKRFRK